MAKLYRSGGSTTGESCTLDASSAGLQARVGDDVVTLSWGSIEAKLGGWEDSWAIFAGDGGEVWVEQSNLDELAPLRPASPPAFLAQIDGLKQTHKRRSGSRTAIRAASALVFLAVLVWFFTGGLVGLALEAIPTSLEVQLGEVAAETTLGESTLCEDPQVLMALSTILERLAAQLPDTPYPLTVRVVQSEEVNAFALPGGAMFVNTALLEESGSEHELAAVLGHEVQHVLQRHGLKRILTQAGTLLLVTVVLGDASEVAQLIGLQAADLGNLSFGRDQERESDSLGLALMARAGFDPQGGVDFFGRLAELSGEGSLDRALAFTRTHPASSERQERLVELAAAHRPGTITGVSDDWTALKNRCGGASP